jgi:hypothetical protein
MTLPASIAAIRTACGNERRFDARHFSRNVLPTSESREARAIGSIAYESVRAGAVEAQEVPMKCGLLGCYLKRNDDRTVAEINWIRTENTAFVEYDVW